MSQENVLSSEYTGDQVAHTAQEALQSGSFLSTTHPQSFQTGQTYDDAREADKRQHKGHVGLGGGDTTPRFERVDGLSAAQYSSQKQSLRFKRFSIRFYERKCVWFFSTDIGHDPRKQHLREKKKKVSGMHA